MRINYVAKGLGFRHLQVILLFSGLAIAFALRVNLSVGIVAMTSNDSNAGEVGASLHNIPTTLTI